MHKVCRRKSRLRHQMAQLEALTRATPGREGEAGVVLPLDSASRVGPVEHMGQVPRSSVHLQMNGRPTTRNKKEGSTIELPHKSASGGASQVGTRSIPGISAVLATSEG
jgi:hypothetical protein